MTIHLKILKIQQRENKLIEHCLKLEIESKGYSLKDLSKKINLPFKKLNDYFKKSKSILKSNLLKKYANLLILIQTIL